MHDIRRAFPAAIGRPHRRAVAAWFGSIARMVVLLCLIALALPDAHGAQVAVPPMSGGRVVDTSGTLAGSGIAGLEDQIRAIEQGTGAQLAVLVVPTTGDDSIEHYATRVFDRWKLGSADRDDGILLLVALDDRRMRIEVGQGLEGTVPDIDASRIIDSRMKPRFKEGDYAGGIASAIDALAGRLDNPTGGPDTAPEPLADEGAGTPFSGIEVTDIGWTLFAMLPVCFALGVWRALRPGRHLVTAALVAAPPAVAAAVMKTAGLAPALLMPSLVFFILGFGCGRSSYVRWTLAGVVAVVAALTTLGAVVGADRFWWGFLYAMAGGVGCLLVAVVVIGARMAFKRNRFEFAARTLAVLGIAGWTAMETSPGATLDSWIPVAAATGLAMLFGYFPSDGRGSSVGSGASNSSRSRSSDRSSGSSSSRSSSSSSSSRSSGGGSSSGGGASGSW